MRHNKEPERCNERSHMPQLRANATKKKGFPGGAVVESPSANAGDTGSKPWSGNIPHAAEQLGP